MTTFAAFSTAISGLTITGVTRTYTSTPESLGAADLPAQFPRLPSGDFEAAPISCTAIGDTRSIELVVCLEPGGLEIASQNYDDTIEMMDYIETAIKAYDASASARGYEINYNIATSGDTPVIVGTTAYWAVVATITQRG